MGLAAAAGAAAAATAEGGRAALDAVRGKDGELLADVPGAAVRAVRLLAHRHELLVVGLALHADELVDRHGPNATGYSLPGGTGRTAAAFVGRQCARSRGRGVDPQRRHLRPWTRPRHRRGGVRDPQHDPEADREGADAAARDPDARDRVVLRRDADALDHSEPRERLRDRKSTRLNSSHITIS